MEKRGMINVRVTTELLNSIDLDRQRLGMTRTDWIIGACEQRLAGPTRREVTVVRSGMLRVGRVPPHLCTHPMQVRSEPGVDGLTRCMSCNSTIEKI